MNSCEECDAALKPEFEWGCTWILYNENRIVSKELLEMWFNIKPEFKWEYTQVWNMDFQEQMFVYSVTKLFKHEIY